MPEQQVGRVIQVIGPVLDIQFEQGHLPAIYNAVRITSEGFNLPEPLDVTAEVQQHLGEGRVRTVAMEPTEGMVRGMKAVDLGMPITVPVGRATLGRVMNVLGKPVDQLGPLKSETNYSFSDTRAAEQAVLEGRKNRLVRRRGCRKNCFDSGVDSQRRDAARRRVRVRRRRRADARRKRPVAGIPGVRRRGSGQFRKVARSIDLRADD